MYTVSKKEKTQKSIHKSIELRCFKNVNQEEVTKMFKSAPWWSKNIQDRYNMFEHIIKYVLNAKIPFKTVRVKVNKKTWITSEYEYAYRLVQKARKTFHRTRSQIDYNNYKSMRNSTTHLKMKLKAASVKKNCKRSYK